MKSLNSYHTHTHRCKHASGDVSAYAEIAVRRNMSILGISDHTPLPDNRWPEVRMRMDELDLYEEEIETAREKFPELTILKGMECEWAPFSESFYRDELLAKREFDYLAGASHWFPWNGEWLLLSELKDGKRLKAYADLLARTMESGLFAFIVHPDAFGIGYRKWDDEAKACSDDIIAASIEYSVPLEINGFGFRKKLRPYPLPPFWERAAAAGAVAVCNSDAHKPEDVNASLDLCIDLACAYGIRVIDPFDSSAEPVHSGHAVTAPAGC